MRLPISPSYTFVPSCTVSEIPVLQVFELMTPPIFHPNFVGVPVDQVSHGVSSSRNLKLIRREIIFKVLESNLCAHGHGT